MNIALNELLAFIGMVIMLVMIPGPNTVLVIQTVGIAGRKAGLYNVAGIITALYFHAALSTIGLSIIIMQSAQAYSLVKCLGALYIIYLGASSLFSAYNLKTDASRSETSANETSAAERKLPQASLITFYIKGLITNILNPKVAIFFLSLFPQFIHSQQTAVYDSLFLTFTYSVISASWYSSLAVFVDKFGSYLDDSTVKRRLQTVTGLLLIGLGMRIFL